MSSPRLIGFSFAALLGFLLLPAAVMAAGADKAPAPDKAAPKEALLNPNNPKASFDADRSLSDPFFPNSHRQKVVVQSIVAPSPITAKSFKLQGVSFADQPLAIINNRNIDVGERVEVLLDSGQKVWIRVLSVKDTVVKIYVESVGEQFDIPVPKILQ